jgi:SAM-dependent methyltransferase
MGSRAQRATLLVADIVEVNDLPDHELALELAMGDPLSICSDAPRAAREMFRILRPGGTVIATADNKLAAIEHYVEAGNLDKLEDFARSGKTNWLTNDQREQFELTTFTPASLRKLFEKAGFEITQIVGKTVVPVRRNRRLLESERAIDRLIKIEAELSKDPASAAVASHLQIVAKKPD